MGNCRRCSSFDEFPVGKNPEIRRVLCPDEECHRARKDFEKVVPECSGMYQFEKQEGTFERMVPRTPTPIVINVPKPRPLRDDELAGIAHEIMRPKRQKTEEPMYLPPIFAQCQDQFLPGCCPKQNNNICNEEKKNSFAYSNNAENPNSASTITSSN